MACFPRIYILELLLPNLDPLTTLLPESRNPSLNLVFSRLGLGFSLRPKSCFRLEKKTNSAPSSDCPFGTFRVTGYLKVNYVQIVSRIQASLHHDGSVHHDQGLPDFRTFMHDP